MVKRREFLIITSGLAASFALEKVFHISSLVRKNFTKNIEFAIAFAPDYDTKASEIEPASPAYLTFLDPNTLSLDTFSVPFRVHAIVQNPDSPAELFLIPKNGKHVARFHRKRGLERVAETAGARQVFGHGVWDAESRGFWVTEMDDAESRGYLIFRDRELNEIRKIPTFGKYPHDVQWDDSGRLIVANSGMPAADPSDAGGVPNFSSLVWIDPRQGKAEHKLEFRELRNSRGATHFIQLRDRGEIYVGGIPIPNTGGGAPSLFLRINSNREYKIFSLPPEFHAKFTGELLSFAYCPKNGHLFWTNPRSDSVFRWDVATETVVSVAAAGKATGLAQHLNQIFFTNNVDMRIHRQNALGAPERIQSSPQHYSSMQWGAHFSELLKS